MSDQKKITSGRITEYDIYLFQMGNHYQIYEKMGAHLMTEKGVKGTYFVVWAPNAKQVSVVGDFNAWNAEKNLMKQIKKTGVYELFIPGIKEGDIYKYAVTDQYNNVVMKADPYGNQSQMRPNTASVVTDLDTFKWSDSSWQRKKKKLHDTEQPMAIYEVHLGSWKKTEDGSNQGFLNYKVLAEQLVEYMTYMGYTHVELIGISESPLDASWGYQVTGYYAPTSRYGTPQEFMYFIDYMHKHGFGVILDWVPAHFPKDAHGLARFDGTPLYEHPDPFLGEHPEWGTLIFNYTKTEVKNFLVANALYWLEKFHVDGLRVDAVASMLYLDYCRSAGQWRPNDEGGNLNKEAIEFLKHLNSIIRRRVPGAMMMAEESTIYPGITKLPEDDPMGLGFTYKWNMGWMHDFLEYMKKDPIYRRYHQSTLTSSFSYMHTENFILVLSHDEVVHLKNSMIGKMPGFLDEKFGNLRAAYGLMTAHPGKKLLFMGQDFAQFREWSEERSLDWFLLDNEEAHRQLNTYYKDLLHFYTSHKALYELDDDPAGFMWINGGDADRNMLTFCRLTKSGRKCLMFHFNFSPMTYENFRSGVPCPGTYTEVFNNSRTEYGGRNMLNPEPIKSEKIEWDFKPNSIGYKLAPFGMVVFEFNMKKAYMPASAEKEKTGVLEAIKSVIKEEKAEKEAKTAKKAAKKTTKKTSEKAAVKKTEKKPVEKKTTTKKK